MSDPWGSSGQPSQPPGWGGGPPPPGPYGGWPTPPYPAPGGPVQPPQLPTSSRATTVFVLGIVALVTFFALCGLGVVAAVIALAMAPGARREIAAAGGALGGEGQLRAGVIMSWITVGLTLLVLVVVAAAIALFVASVGDDSSGQPTVSSHFDLRRGAG